jgi:hypothetical protein
MTNAVVSSFDAPRSLFKQRKSSVNQQQPSINRELVVQPTYCKSSIKQAMRSASKQLLKTTASQKGISSLPKAPSAKLSLLAKSQATGS